MHSVFRRTLLTLLPTLLFAVGVRADEPEEVMKIRAAAEKVMKENGVPGAVIGIWRTGQPTRVLEIGLGDVEKNTAISREDHVRIASITKTFTTTVILQLATEGKVSLDDPVSRYVDGIPNGEHITLRQLAGNTSGLVDYLDVLGMETIVDDPLKQWTPEDLVKMAVNDPKNPLFPPGKSWSYSNTNFILLGMVAEKATGKSIGENIRERIIEPLKLKNTSYPEGPEMPKRHAHGYVAGKDGKLKDVTVLNPSFGGAAGAMISTLDDLEIWSSALAKGTLLTPEIQKQRMLFTPMQPHSTTSFYGLGMANIFGWVGHNGEIPGFNSAMYYQLSDGARIIVLINKLDFDKSVADEIFAECVRVLYPDLLPAKS